MPPPALGTPSHEWANETTHAAGLDADEASFTAPDPLPNIPGTSSFAPPAVSTPSSDFPGAYPLTRGNTERNDPNELVEQAKGIVPSQEDLNNTLRSAQETAAGALQTAAETAKQYLPASVASYIPGSNQDTTTASHDSQHTTSLASTELTGARPGEHVGGAGALPGTISETGVAKVLDERTPGERGSTLEGQAASGKDEVAGIGGIAMGGAYGAKEIIAPSKNIEQPAPASTSGRNNSDDDDLARTVATVGGITLGGAYGAGEVIAPRGEPQQPSTTLGGVPQQTSGAPQQPSAVLAGAPRHPAFAGAPQQPLNSVFNTSLETSSGNRAGEKEGGAGSAAFERKQSVPRVRPEDMVERGRVEGQRRFETDPLVAGDKVQGKTGGQGVSEEAREVVRERKVSGGSTSGKGEGKVFPSQVPLNTTGRAHALGSEGAMYTRGVDDVEAVDERKPTGTGQGQEGEYHPAELHPPREGLSSAPSAATGGPQARYYCTCPVTHFVDPDCEQGTVNGHSVHEAEGRDHRSAGEGESGGRHRPSFMEKVRGEAKVISGKLTGRREKVEEGVRVKRGQGVEGFGSAVKEAVHADGKAA
ncbi:hypothetical protein NEOLEDRAFT_1181407 [Neolentinus lepideus HHB14362 ss-1]|uniref:Uncharacterized protein n=1 Tax=Neolentinus lepideus HHB14362 ss-1 TaxID=1314782 RepID=A0A165Q015_9AGAM|nr:hypothetical protein NEOLEDRAFT_1181407 [Neolentinus lepideus HHB14362 ss-1]